jgi:hypothetical protein
MTPRNQTTEDIKIGEPLDPRKAWRKTYLLVMWCPGHRWRDSNPGFHTELENLQWRWKGKRHKWQNHEAESTKAPNRDGLLRSSEEAG